MNNQENLEKAYPEIKGLLEEQRDLINDTNKFIELIANHVSKFYNEDKRDSIKEYLNVFEVNHGIDTLLSRDDLGFLDKYSLLNGRLKSCSLDLAKISSNLNYITGKED